MLPLSASTESFFKEDNLEESDNPFGTVNGAFDNIQQQPLTDDRMMEDCDQLTSFDFSMSMSDFEQQAVPDLSEGIALDPLLEEDLVPQSASDVTFSDSNTEATVDPNVSFGASQTESMTSSSPIANISIVSETPSPQHVAATSAPQTTTTVSSGSSKSNKKKRKRTSTSKSSSRSSKRKKVSDSKRKALEDQNRLDYLNSLSDDELTAELKEEKKKVYNRITARESRKRQKDRSAHLERENRRLQQENEALQRRVQALEQRLGNSVRPPSSPDNNSESANSDHEGETSNAALGPLFFIIFLFLVAVLVGGAVMENLSSPVAPAPFASSNGLVPYYKMYSDQCHRNNHVAPVKGTTSLVHDAKQNTFGSHSLYDTIIPQYPSLPPSASHYDHNVEVQHFYDEADVMDETVIQIPQASGSPTMGTLFTKRDEDKGATTYMFAPTMAPLLSKTEDTGSDLSKLSKSEIFNRLVVLFPSQEDRQLNGLSIGADEKVLLPFSQAEIGYINLLEEKAYMMVDKPSGLDGAARIPSQNSGNRAIF